MDRIRITHAVAEKLRALHLAPGKRTEALSYAFANALETERGDLVVVMADPENVFLLAPNCYRAQDAAHLTVHPDVRAGVICRGIDEKRKALTVVDIHDHWFARDAAFSGTDDRDDLRAARLMRKDFVPHLEPGREIHLVSILIAREGWRARRVVWDDTGRPVFRDVLVDIPGDRHERHGLAPDTKLAWQHRQSAMISPAHRAALRSLRVALAGGGGTGSIMLEALLRLGIQHIDVIDGDAIEASNLNRLQGASFSDVCRNKAEFLAARARMMFDNADVRAIPMMAHAGMAVQALQGADLIIGCVDNHETRWFLNQVAVQYAIPWFDCATAVTTGAGGSPVFLSTMNAVIPGRTACGHCSTVTFYERKRPAAFLSMETLAEQRAAGYILDEPEAASPSIYFLNMQTVSTLIRELMNWFCGWTPPAINVFQRSDDTRAERLDLNAEASLVRPRDTCPVCGTLLGRCQEDELPHAGRSLQACHKGETARTASKFNHEEPS
ncbi:MAG: ThiF family adenylyltransferase [Azoarcus sp.]|jgi:hypothetical protein|nr:ThiF family adenylyltransferase [Azoarcus sp.]